MTPRERFPVDPRAVSPSVLGRLAGVSPSGPTWNRECSREGIVRVREKALPRYSAHFRLAQTVNLRPGDWKGTELWWVNLDRARAEATGSRQKMAG